MSNPLYKNPLLKKYRQRLRRKATYSEKVLWQDLRNRKMKGVKFYRQFSIGNYICDFYSHEANLAVELDGSTHSLPRVIENDQEKSLYMGLNGIRLLRFTDEELLNNYENALKLIEEAIAQK